MIPYWLLFGFFALGTLISRARVDPAKPYLNLQLLAGVIGIGLMVGFRDHVGGDWQAYADMFNYAERLSLRSTLELTDPGYRFLNWLVHSLDGEYYQVNVICGAIFAWGLYRFAKVQPDPWLAVAVAIPYLVIVVAMGYSRQGVAIGILMAGLAALLGGASFWRFTIYAVIAALFHSSALIVLPLAVIGMNRNRLAQLTAVPAILFVGYTSLFSSNVDQYVDSYITYAMSSQGAAIRVALCVLPALIFLRFWPKLRLSEMEHHLWRNFAIASLICLVLLYVLPSTAVDRLALYILPIQIAVFTRLHFLVNNVTKARFLVLALSAAVQFTWLNFAATSQYWVPYRIV